MEEKFTNIIRNVIRLGMVKLDDERQAHPELLIPNVNLTSLRLQYGHFVIGCADEKTRMWLENYIKNYRWAVAGIPFKILYGDIREVKVSPTYMTNAPNTLNYTQVKDFLKNQHRVDTGKWKLLHAFKVNDKENAKFLIISDDVNFNEKVKGGTNKQIKWPYYTSPSGILAIALPMPSDSGKPNLSKPTPNSKFFLYFKKHQRKKFEWKLNPMPLKTRLMKLMRQSWLDIELTGKTWRECSQTCKNRIKRFRFPSPNGTKPNELTRARATLTSQQKYLPPPRTPLYNLKIVRNSLTHAPEIYEQHEPKGNLNRCHAPEIYALHAIRNFE